MAGQPTVLDCAAVIPIESGVPLAPPYGIITAPNTLSLRAYFHCGGKDRVERARINAVLLAAPAKVTYFVQNLQTLASFSVLGGPIAALPTTTVQAEFQGAGDLVGSGLDPTDDYYLSAAVAIPIPVPAAGNSETWRVLTVLHGGAGTGVSAFDDRAVVQIIA